MPSHIAIIMDGNGRWAKKKLLPRTVGHKEGIKTAQKITSKCIELKIKYLTLFAFSTENWKRPKKEIDTLWGYLNEYLIKESPKLVEEGVKLRMIGFREQIPEAVLSNIDDVIKKSQNNAGLNLNIALNYSGRAEIIHAFNNCLKRAEEGRLNYGEVDMEKARELMLTGEIPDPDLLIRTGGELRISNFFLFQIAYTELYFSTKLWPEFGESDLSSAIECYNKRTRKFGGITD